MHYCDPLNEAFVLNKAHLKSRVFVGKMKRNKKSLIVKRVKAKNIQRIHW